MNDIGPELPVFLSNLSELRQHFDHEYQGLSNTEKGRRFAEFGTYILPEVKEISHLAPFTLSEKLSNDGGVDIESVLSDEQQVRACIQSKFTITSKDDLDQIFSKFDDYSRSPITQKLFYDEQERTPQELLPVFVIFTLSPIEGVLKKYAESKLSSVSFYQELQRSGRLVIVQGNTIVEHARSAYLRSYVVPSNLPLRSEPGWLSRGGVHIGMVDGGQLIELYGKYGDGMFFENIREFLGLDGNADRESVNESIMRTAAKEPDKMLARNNGITFKARSVEKVDELAVLVTGASIVNGCQTTMCLVSTGELAAGCLVPVKVVETEDAWEVARSANNQNRVKQIDLELARYMRPQLVQRSASDMGKSVDSAHSSIASIFEGISSERLQYEEIRLLYIGLFSTRPNNLFADNYSSLRIDVMAAMFDAGDEKLILDSLIQLAECSEQALKYSTELYEEEAYGHVSRRFQKNPKYRAYLSILAICGSLDFNVQDRADAMHEESARMKGFFDRVPVFLESSRESFDAAYVVAYEQLCDLALEPMTADDDSFDQVLQEMYGRTEKSSFRQLFVKQRGKMRREERKRTGAAPSV